jgi:hypothetical protein
MFPAERVQSLSSVRSERSYVISIFVAPFGIFISVIMIFGIASSFKCAILLFLLSFDFLDRFSDFLYYHLGNVADRCTEHRNDLNGVEIKDTFCGGCFSEKLEKI